jgi:hypothetical protein
MSPTAFICMYIRLPVWSYIALRTAKNLSSGGSSATFQVHVVTRAYGGCVTKIDSRDYIAVSGIIQRSINICRGVTKCLNKNPYLPFFINSLLEKRFEIEGSTETR